MTLPGGDAEQWRDTNANRLAQEFASIEAQLENLRALIATSGQASAKNERPGVASSFGAFAKMLIADRKARNAEFPIELFADPAWDILLDLFVAHVDRRQISVTSAVIASNVPQTTALRWIGLLTDQGYLIRIPDANDRRRVHIELSKDATGRVKNYLRNVSQKWGVVLLDGGQGTLN